MRLWKIIVSLFTIATVIYQYRNRIINILASVPILRKVSIRIAMKIPFLRNRFMQSIFSGK
ncbi:hypothetical protein SAMN04487944_101484 [Gracilibacillus ureilyticus]|uniref:Uncharacterized protein n=1 Tax=Gracilibacillus ureilyticus TaxID=531814 RepID=A0A1H9LZZ1_9BACI|nr:hypothetical protein SAMN04487944_101484 [Gracilibacillus ureilyticus]